MQRTVEITEFEMPRGRITVGELMAMEPAVWEHLRSEINLRRTADPDRPLARCHYCQSSIYIRAQATRDGNVPMFVHFQGADPECPWFAGKNVIPDDARAAQYRGHQECALHRWMCDMIASFLEMDPRLTKLSVDRYLKPQIEERGRYPDVYAELDGLGKFAFEVQLSKPFAFEIAARHRHYQAEGVSLIWVFRALDGELPQGFRDVITMQRGNAFLFDDAAFNASVAANGLRLCSALNSPILVNCRIGQPTMPLPTARWPDLVALIRTHRSTSELARLFDATALSNLDWKPAIWRSELVPVVSRHQGRRILDTMH